MSVFDAVAFENQIIDQSNETKSTPLPEGPYSALCDSVKIKSVQRKDGSSAPVLEVHHQILDLKPEVKELFGDREKITVRQDIWLDVTENGTLAFGPNTNLGLGRLREATGTNNGKSFTFKLLEGKGPYKIVIAHRTTENGDVFNDVKRTEPAKANRPASKE